MTFMIGPPNRNGWRPPYIQCDGPSIYTDKTGPCQWRHHEESGIQRNADKLRRAAHASGWSTTTTLTGTPGTFDYCPHHTRTDPQNGPTMTSPTIRYTRRTDRPVTEVTIPGGPSGGRVYARYCPRDIGTNKRTMWAVRYVDDYDYEDGCVWPDTAHLDHVELHLTEDGARTAIRNRWDTEHPTPTIDHVDFDTETNTITIIRDDGTKFLVDIAQLTDPARGTAILRATRA